jgi:ComF family protein
VRKLLKKWLSPQAPCFLCLSIQDVEFPLCQSCIEALPWIERACTGCGLVLAEDKTGPLCGRCMIYRFPFDSVKVAFEYKWPCDRFIAHIKFKKKLDLVNLLGQLMANKFRENPPKCLIPVPLHPKRLKERGFNQAYVLAKVIGKILDIPVVWKEVTKQKQTQAQSSLSIEERLLNLQSAFEISKDFPAHFKSSVAIIDDVMTTGQTLSSLTLALKGVGVQRVEVWCCCRTLKHSY